MIEDIEGGIHEGSAHARELQQSMLTLSTIPPILFREILYVNHLAAIWCQALEYFGHNVGNMQSTSGCAMRHESRARFALMGHSSVDR